MSKKKAVVILAVLCIAAGLKADVFFTADEGMTNGYMTWYETDCSTWVNGGVWGIPDLRATPSGATSAGNYQVSLQANTNTCDGNPKDPFWVNQTTGEGNKCMEASFYRDVDGLDGQAITFGYKTLLNELAAEGYECRAFIKVLDANAGWVTTTYVWADLTAGTHNVLSIPGSVVVGSDPRVQCGFSIKGRNVFSTNPIADLEVIVAPYRNKATNPNPADGSNVGLDTSALSWMNADPNDPSDTISCNVYFKIDDGDPNFYDGPIATGITDETIVLANYGITLSDDTTYVWRVDCIDPHGDDGGPLTMQGDLWTFMVTDVPPVVNAGLNQYVYLSGGTAAFTLSGSYTDDAKSEIVRAEFVEGVHESDPAIIVAYGAKTWNPGAGIHSAGTVTQEITVNGTGWFAFNLEVEDGAGVGMDEGVTPVATPHDEPGVRAGVYETCAEAAVEDPYDLWDATGDLNGDCRKDLADLALLAAGWLDCDPVKTTCP